MNKTLLKRHSLFLIATLCVFASSLTINGMDQEETTKEKAEAKERTEKTFQDWAEASTDGKGKVHLHAYIAMPGAFNQFQPKTDEELDEEVAQEISRRKKLQTLLISSFNVEHAKLAGKEQAWGTLEAQRILSQRPIKEVVQSGLISGLEQGTAQIVATLMVELTQVAFIKSVEWYMQPSEEEISLLQRIQQAEAEMTQQQELLNNTQKTLRNNSPLVNTLVDGAHKLDEEKAKKKMALAALMKYGQQVNMLLDIQNDLMFGIESEQPAAAA